MKKLILFFLVLGLSFGQTSGANVVYIPYNSNISTGFATTAFTQAITGGTAFISNPLQNIGQSSHTLAITITGSSVNFTINAEIDGSLDGTNWFNIGPPLSVVYQNMNSQISGFQSYPFIRTKATITPGGSDTLTVKMTYVGNSSPSHNLIDILQGDAPIVNSTPATITAGTNDNVLAAVSMFYSNTLYGLILNVPSTVTALTVHCGLTASSPVNVLNLPALSAQGVFVLPTGMRAYAQCALGTGLYLNSTGTGSIGVTAVTRLE